MITKFLIFLCLTIGLFVIGHFVDWGKGVNYFFSLGGITGVFAWHSLCRTLQSSIRSRSPKVSYYMFETGPTYFLSGAFLACVASLALFNFGLKTVSDHIALLAYYAITVYLVQIAIFEKTSPQTGSSTKPNPCANL